MTDLSRVLLLRLQRRFRESNRAARGLRSRDIGMILLHTGISALLVGNLSAAAADFERGRADAEQKHDPYLLRDIISKLALTRVLQGDVTAAESHLQLLRTLPESKGRLGDMVRSGELAASLLIAAERLDAVDVRRLLDATLAPAFWSDELWPFVLLAHRRGAQVLGVPSLVAQRLAQVHEQVPEPLEYPAHLVTICRAETFISQERLSDAMAQLDSLHDSNCIVALPTRAPLALYRGDFVAAEAAATALCDDDEVGPLVRCEAIALRACAANELGKTHLADRLLREAVAIADLQGSARSLAVVPGNLMAPVYARCGLSQPCALVPDARPVVKLTPTLQRLLAQLVAGLSNAQIAELSHVSVNTVKTNIRRLYRALGVHTRREAVGTAARRTLVP